MSLLRIPFVLFALTVALSAGAAQSGRMFDLDNETPTATLPNGLLDGLVMDHRVGECLDQLGGEADSTWFAVHRADLNGDGRDEWIVKGREPCLNGANIRAWWVYEEVVGDDFDGDGDPFNLLLRTDALGIEILLTSSKGYRDLRSHRITAAGDDTGQTFQYTGGVHKYQPAATAR